MSVRASKSIFPLSILHLSLLALPVYIALPPTSTVFSHSLSTCIISPNLPQISN